MKEKKLVEILKRKKYKLTACESCTGGLFASTVVRVPSASSVFDMSFVTYSNLSKMKLCGVKQESVETYGAVSENVAAEMAEGALREANANVSVAISGIAGPTGGSTQKPVGTVCFAFCALGKTSTCTLHFSGGRNVVRKKSVNFAINKLIELLS